MQKWLLVSLLFLSGLSYAQPTIERVEVLNFRKKVDTMVQLKELAKQENKIVFIYAWAKGCPPCKTMKKHVFTNEELAKYFNGHFVSVKKDMGKPEGDEVRDLFEVKAYPTLLFVDTTGKVLLRIEGSLPPDDLLKAVRAIASE